MNQLRILKTALKKFSSVKYSDCLRNLNNLHKDIQLNGISGQISEYADVLLKIIESTETVHEQNIQQSQQGKQFIVAPTHVTKEVSNIVDTLIGIKPHPILSLTKIYFLYLSRELDQAIKLIEQNKHFDNLLFYQIAATVYMLNDSPNEATLFISKASQISKDDETIRLAKRIQKLNQNRSQKRIRSARWPTHMINSDTLKSFCNNNIISEYKKLNISLSQNSQVATIGSCFANNLANSLISNEINAKSFSLGEEINNTYTNYEIFKLLSQGLQKTKLSNEFESTTLTPLINEDFIDELEDFKHYLENADLLVYTLGVSQGFFTFDEKPVLIKGTGGIDRSAFAKSIYRNITVSENISNCKNIINLARIIKPDIPIVFTISPVPLARAFDTDSAVMNDCLSKSTLRVAVQELIESDIQNIYYWPSFEIAKWITPHIAIEGSNEWHFGSDDLYSRHVSRRTVSLIIELFINVFFQKNQ